MTNRAEVQLTELESSAESYRALYDDFLQRYMATVQQQSFPITEARVVTPAARPLTKSHPKTILVLLITTAGGMIFGLAIGHLRDLSDRVFRTRAQVEAALGRDRLATVPTIKVDKPKGQPSRPNNVGNISEAKPPGDSEEQKSLDGETVGELSDLRAIVRRDQLLWQVVDFPLSPFAELIRSIQMAAHLYGATKSNKFRKSKKILGIVSSLPGEGKSTIAASLAQLLSHSGKRVILVDCDLRAPRLTHTMAPGAKAGLVEVVSGDAALDDVLWTDKSTNSKLPPNSRPASPAPHRRNPRFG